MSINIQSTLNNFFKDLDKYINNEDRRDEFARLVSLVARVAGFASLAFGTNAAISMLTASSLTVLPLAVSAAVYLVFGHDLIKVGENLSRLTISLNEQNISEYVQQALENGDLRVSRLEEFTYNEIFKDTFYYKRLC